MKLRYNLYSILGGFEIFRGEFSPPNSSEINIELRHVELKEANKDLRKSKKLIGSLKGKNYQGL